MSKGDLRMLTTSLTRLLKKNNNMNNSPRRWKSALASETKLDRIIYRQLLRWCNDTEEDIPLSSYVPPVSIESPFVNLEALSSDQQRPDDDVDSIESMLPHGATVVDDNKRIVTPVHSARDLKNLFRAVFRCNHHAVPVPEHVRKERITMAFETIKSLNALTESLERRTKAREQHMDRTHVEFRVGQGLFSSCCPTLCHTKQNANALFAVVVVGDSRAAQRRKMERGHSWLGESVQ